MFTVGDIPIYGKPSFSPRVRVTTTSSAPCNGTYCAPNKLQAPTVFTSGTLSSKTFYSVTHPTIRAPAVGTNQWSSNKALTLSNHTSRGVAVLDGFLNTVGRQNSVSYLNNVERYNPKKDKQSKVASMNTRRLGLAVAMQQKHQTRKVWLVPTRTKWPFICHGLKGGSDTPITEDGFQLKNMPKKTFICQNCGQNFTAKRNLTAHRKFYCPSTKGLDHLVAAERRSKKGEMPSEDNIILEELRSTTYKVDSEMQTFLSTIPSAYARFRMCENPRNPQPLPGFWPMLFDYRGKSFLSEIESSICTKEIYKNITSILTDAHIYHRVSTITFKKRAFVESEDGQFFEITDYRVPKSHCTVRDEAQMRLDRPKFNVQETESEITISLHKKYLDLLPCILPPLEKISDGQDECIDSDQDEYQEEECMEEVQEDDIYNIKQIFDSYDEEIESFSQEFSQVSVEDSEFIQSPENKKIRLSATKYEISKTEHYSSFPEKNKCPLCGSYISGHKRYIQKHILKSCPKNPDIDDLEAARRQKRTEKQHNININIGEYIEKEEKDIPTDNDNQEVNRRGGCGCDGSSHRPGCLRLRGGAGHIRREHQNQAPHLQPDPDFLPQRLLIPIIPIIQALNNKFSNRQNRWIAGQGPPRIPTITRNTHWPRVVNKNQLPSLFSDQEFQDLFYFHRQKVYQFRNAHVYPMLQQRAAQAQGPHGACSSLPHTLTPDSLSCLFLAKVRLNESDRLVAAQLGVTHRVAQKWIKALRDHYFSTDPFIQRNLNLGIQANLQALLRQGVEATLRDQRATALYGHLTRPNTELLICIIDSRAVKIQMSSDGYLQKRTLSTKIHNNSVQKMTISTVEGLPMITFPLMCSLSPAGTDESNCEHLITIHEGGVAGGLFAFLESPLTEPVTLILLQDQGFRKMGFDRQVRRSFIDYEDDLQRRSNGGFRYFTPCFPSDMYCDQQFNPVGQYAILPGGPRHRCRTANTSAACCTKTRWPIESLFGRESQFSLLGAQTEVPNQLLSPCGIPNFDSQSKLMVWLQIGDSLLYHHGVPFSYRYRTVDTYQDHGHDIRQRITLENPLSSLSGVQWSRDDIFARPRGQNPQTNQGQAIRRVSLLNPQQTGMTQITSDELSSVTMGSFQYRLMRSYVTRLR